MRALSAALIVLSLAANGVAQSPADALRAEAKTTALAEIPDDYRAVTLGGNGELTPWLLFGFSGGGGSAPGQQVFLRALGAVWVQPDEFAELLDGKRPRIRGYKLDLTSLAGAASSAQPPALTFSESWLEAGRIVTWSPAPDLSKAALTSAMSAMGRATAEAVETTSGEAAAAASGPMPATSSDATRRLVDLKQIALAIIMYAGDDNDRFPKAQASAQLQPVIAPYLKSGSVFAKNSTAGRVLYNTRLSGVSMTQIAEPASTILLWEENAWPDGKRAVAYTDGHVKRLTESAWSKAWKTELARRAAK